MHNYPPTVATIANDYLDRVKSLLRSVPVCEQEEFLREIQSHVYEAYLQTSGEDEVARILAVLRNLGDPTEVVADRLPGAMVRSGTKRNLPLLVLGGVFIALFGIPLGFGGVGVLVGILAALAGVLVAYYAVTGAFLFTGAVLMFAGLIRIYWPSLWEKLVALGVFHMDGPGELLSQLAPWAEGFVLLILAGVFVVSGLGMLRLGKYFLRGMRFLCTLAFDWVRRLAQSARRWLSTDKGERVHVSSPSFVK